MFFMNLLRATLTRVAGAEGKSEGLLAAAQLVRVGKKRGRRGSPYRPFNAACGCKIGFMFAALMHSILNFDVN